MYELKVVCIYMCVLGVLMVVVYSLQFIDALNVIGLSKLLNESTCLNVTVMVVLYPCVHSAP